MKACWLLVLVGVLLAGPLAQPSISSARALAALSDPGPYPAGWRTVTVTRASPAGTFEAVLYYPAASAGQGAPIAPGGGPFPAITFGHGFFSSVSDYDSTLRHLASHGYLVIATTDFSGFQIKIDHAAYAGELRDALTYLEQENARAGSPLLGRVNTGAFGASGHSMGAGVSILAAAADARIRAVANLAAEADTDPSAAQAAANLRAPLRLIAASQDKTTPVQDHQQAIYNNAPPPRQLAVIQGAGHCGFVDNPVIITGLCEVGTLGAPATRELARAWLTGWFDYYLKGDAALEPLIWGGQLHADPRVVVTAENSGQPAPTATATGVPTATPTPDYRRLRLPLVWMKRE